MHTPCPLCGSSKLETLRRFGLDEAAELFVPQASSPAEYQLMQELLFDLWQAREVAIVHCAACDFGFADPFLAGTPDFYQLQAPDTPYPDDKWEFQRTLRALQGRQDSGCDLLDIGAGKGYFLAHLLAHGWDKTRLSATEYSGVGRLAVERLGVHCVPADLRDLTHADAFDVICMFEVLEHLDGYDALFAAIDRIGRASADLFIAVPNGARIMFNEQNGLQYDCPPNHISRWSPRSFDVLAGNYGWTVEACEFEPPPTMRQEAIYGAVNRYIRNSHHTGSWSRFTYGVANRNFNQSGKVNKAIKAIGMALSPDAWRAAVGVGGQSRGGGVPHALWAHLRRVHT